MNNIPHPTTQKQFNKHFKAPMNKFYNRDLLQLGILFFDIINFDDYIRKIHGEYTGSLKDRIQHLYGQEAMELINNIIKGQ